MEKIPQPEATQYVDILAKVQNRNDYLRQILAAEESAAQIDPDNDLPNEPLHILDEMLDAEEGEMPVTFSGVAFKIDDYDELIDEPCVLTDQPVVFGGANYHIIDEVPRILFDLRDEATEPHTCYAAPFEAILRLHGEKPSLHELLNRHASNSKGLVTNPDFLTADKGEQDELLKSAAVSCFNELMPLIDPTGNSIECTEFYTHKDDKNEKELILKKIDQSEVNFEDRIAVIGVIVGVIYPEAIQRQQPFRSDSDFTYGGAPCLTVRNDKAGMTTFIPIDHIEDIETNT